MNGRLQKWLVSVIFASDLISDRKYSCVDYLCVLIEFWSVTSQVFKCFGEFHPTGSASAYLTWSSVIFLEGSIPWLQLVEFCLAFFTSRSMIIHLKETACILYSVLPNDISMSLFFVSETRRISIEICKGSVHDTIHRRWENRSRKGWKKFSFLYSVLTSICTRVL